VTFQNARNVIRELVALTIAQCFCSIYFQCELLGLFNFDLSLDLKVLASASTSPSSVWPRPRPW